MTRGRLTRQRLEDLLKQDGYQRYGLRPMSPKYVWNVDAFDNTDDLTAGVGSAWVERCILANVTNTVEAGGHENNDAIEALSLAWFHLDEEFVPDQLRKGYSIKLGLAITRGTARAISHLNWLKRHVRTPNDHLPFDTEPESRSSKAWDRPTESAAMAAASEGNRRSSDIDVDALNALADALGRHQNEAEPEGQSRQP